jgi:hypothetical protein
MILQYVNNAPSVTPVALSFITTFNNELALVQLLDVSVPELRVIQLFVATIYDPYTPLLTFVCKLVSIVEVHDVIHAATPAL